MHTDGAPKIFWLGINRGLDKIIELQEIVSNLLHDCDVLFDDRNFIPHITLGRIKNDAKANKINSEMYLNAVFSPIRFRVKSFHLYSSDGSEKVITCETPEQFLDVLKLCREVIGDVCPEVLAYTEPAVKL